MGSRPVYSRRLAPPATAQRCRKPPGARGTPLLGNGQPLATFSRQAGETSRGPFAGFPAGNGPGMRYPARPTALGRRLFETSLPRVLGQRAVKEAGEAD